VAHACNSSYSGGRDQGSWFQTRLGQIVHKNLSSKKKKKRKKERKKITKRAGGVAQSVDPEFKPQYCQKEKIPIRH
jgi:hypothetical protein